MPHLVAAYLEWRSAPRNARPIDADASPEDIVPPPERPPTPVGGEDEDGEAALPSDISPEEGDFVMQGVDVFGKSMLQLLCYANSFYLIDYNIYQFRRPTGMIYTNEALIRSGFIGSAPLYPTIAISLRTLEDYRQTHRVCPRLSVQATVRKLCHVHNVSKITFDIHTNY